MRVFQRNFVDGVASFQPAAFIGLDLLKSSVQWSDIGGRHAVRTVLNDTLKLLTHVRRRYDGEPGATTTQDACWTNMRGIGRRDLDCIRILRNLVTRADTESPASKSAG